MQVPKKSYAVKLFKNLANGNRLEILELLSASSQEPVNVNAIAEALNIHQATLSTHLQRMRRDGIISAKQEGQNMYYSIKDKNALKFLKQIS